ncbi:MAG: fibrinogen-like YCDxxxxGGGW domain-containing protein, partial [Myxococcota bacterium]
MRCLRIVFIVLIFCAFDGCSGSAIEEGEVGAICSPTQQCNPGLNCEEGLCSPTSDPAFQTTDGADSPTPSDVWIPDNSDTQSDLTDASVSAPESDSAAGTSQDVGESTSPEDVITDASEPASPGEFGDPCEEDADCYSGLCGEHLGDEVCTKTCESECPPGWSCEQVVLGGGDPTYICVSLFEHLCKPCMEGSDCESLTTAAACITYEGEGSFCGASCEVDAECPEGFKCQEAVSTRGGSSKQCVNSSGVCECSDHAVELGLQTQCDITNEFGTCSAMRMCTADGLSACEALVPSAEVCNGEDDDCDGEVDEDEPCDDDDVCTFDTCLSSGACSNDIIVGTPCDDGDPATINDTCQPDGSCEGDTTTCPSGTCILDAVPNGEECDITYKPAGAVCDDEDLTTNVDVCDGQGACAGTPYTCEPALCESQSIPNGMDCDVDYWADGHPCDDGSLETKDDVCDGAGGCAGTPYTCDTGQCITSSVANGQSCDTLYKPAGTGCDDGDPATSQDACDGQGGCAGQALDCPLGPCVESASPNGISCGYVYAEVGSACDDGDSNTEGDSCSAQGECIGELIDCPLGPCDESSTPNGEGCDTVYKAAGTICDDGLSTTKDDMCDAAGTCGGTPYTCAPGVCELASTPNGQDCDATFAPLGTDCDDEELGTQNDTCDGEGTCAGTPYTCEPGPCEISSVPNGEGCTVVVFDEGTACDDGDPTTADDTCNAQGECGGTAIECQPQQCEITSQPDGAGCAVTYAEAGTPCDDSDKGTQEDLCDAEGACAGTPYACEPGPCEVSSVPNGEGCDVTLAQPGAPCDDGDEGTEGESCDPDGACVGLSDEYSEGVDCTDIWKKNPDAPSGTYIIDPDGVPTAAIEPTTETGVFIKAPEDGDYIELTVGQDAGGSGETIRITVVDTMGNPGLNEIHVARLGPGQIRNLMVDAINGTSTSEYVAYGPFFDPDEGQLNEVNGIQGLVATPVDGDTAQATTSIQIHGVPLEGESIRLMDAHGHAHHLSFTRENDNVTMSLIGLGSEAVTGDLSTVAVKLAYALELADDADVLEVTAEVVDEENRVLLTQNAAGEASNVPMRLRSLKLSGGNFTGGEGPGAAFASLRVSTEIPGKAGSDITLVASSTQLSPTTEIQTAAWWNASEPPYEAYCDMTSDGGGWTRVASMNFASDACPGEWLAVDGAPRCARTAAAVDPSTYARSALFASNILDVKQVRGQVTARQFGSPQAYGGTVAQDAGLEEVYMAGLSWTLGAPTQRHHVYSQAVSIGTAESGEFETGDLCPIDGGTMPPYFANVETSAMCQTGNEGGWDDIYVWHDAPLFSSQAFVANVDYATETHLEGRIMAPDFATNEDIGVESVDLYVRSCKTVYDGQVNGATQLSGTGGYGASLADLGDLDGDGVPDLAVGMPSDGSGGFQKGAVTIQFMNADGTVKSQMLIAPGLAGFDVDFTADSGFGSALATLGDIDGDGVTDLAVHSNGLAFTGSVWILRLNTDGTVKGASVIDADTIADGLSSFGGTLSEYDRFGAGIGALPDMNGDGVPELLVGSPGDDGLGEDRGALYLLNLSLDGGLTHVEVLDIADFVYAQDGPANSAPQELGASIAVLGDPDLDGIIEVAVGAPGNNFGCGEGGGSNENCGGVWRLWLEGSGAITASSFLSTATLFGEYLPDARLGASLSVAGDLDNSGSQDLLVGAPGLNDGAGGVVLVYSPNFVDNLIDNPTTPGTHIDSLSAGLTPAPQPGDGFGAALAFMDFDGDGVHHLLSGAPSANSADGALWTVGMHQACTAWGNGVVE